MKYFAFYDVEQYAAEKRSVTPAALNVVRYMADTMVSAGEDVSIISAAKTLADHGFFRGRRVRVSDRITLRQPPSFGTKTRIGSAFVGAFTRLWLLFRLLFGTHRGERITIYHSAALMSIYRLAIRLKKLSCILEIREIYADVVEDDALRKKEMAFFALADGYIFATVQLNDLINRAGKPYCIATGIYRPEKRLASPPDDGIIHVVYAGILCPVKNGAYNAIDAARYLDEHYHIHILGFGTEEDVKKTCEKIDAVNRESSCAVTYDGLLKGDAFSAFLQTCHIGLSTQNGNAAFSDTSFPSKVLTYLVNGLAVVSGRIPVVEKSAVGQFVTYYEGDDAQSLASAIRRVSPDEVDRRDALSALDKKLASDLADLFHR